jgi:hypothetical protein
MLEECCSSFDFCNTLFSNDIVLDRFRVSEGLKVCSIRRNCLSDLRDCPYLLLMVSPGNVTLSTTQVYMSAKCKKESSVFKPKSFLKTKHGPKTAPRKNFFTAFKQLYFASFIGQRCFFAVLRP